MGEIYAVLGLLVGMSMVFSEIPSPLWPNKQFVPFLGQKRLEGRSGLLASLSFFSLRARSWHSCTSFLLDQVDHAGNNTAS
jgi:hypothetical protein